MLEAIIRKLRATRSRKEVALALMDSLPSFIGADCVSYFRAEGTELTDKESRGLSPVAVKRYLECAKAGVGDPLLDAALGSGQAVQSCDFVAQPSFQVLYREAAEPWRYRQIAASPIVTTAGAVCAIECFRIGDARPFSPEELRALMSVSIWSSAAMTRVENVDENAARPSLTVRQGEICALLVKGLTNTEIGRALGISENTVKTHLKDVFLRYGVSRRAELAALLR